MAIEAVRVDDKTPHQLLNTVFVTDQDGKFLGSLALADLVRAEAGQNVDELKLVNCSIGSGADFVDVVLMMADYNLIALGVVDSTGSLIGAISVDDLMEALIPAEWRNRVEASSGV
jgi:Mg/Co/Ni transporter MgtE